jgi:Ca2+-binding RTX toxin-like protein
VWYRWTAPASGTVDLDLCETNFDTLLSVYTGGSLGSLKRVKDNNNNSACPPGTWGSKLTFEAAAGTVYNFAVSGAGGARAGLFTLKLNLAVDNTPPPTPVITSPTNTPLLREGAVTVTGTAEPNSTVRLREGEELRGGAQAGSSGAWTAQLTGISDGSHTYVAEAQDKAGNTSAASNSVTITMDSTAPDTTITSGPSGSTNSTTATFGLSSEVGASFECRLTRNGEEPSTFAPCQSPKSYSSLERTGYTFEVRAVDVAGNPDPTPASRSWTISPAPASCTKTGTSGNDVISGTSGDDVICAGAGNDTVKGLGGNDILRGEAGNDKLLGGVGDDTLDGGLGTDTASYSASLTAVTASLATNTASGEGSDTFSTVENLLGSSKADTLTGSGANNTLTGGGGNDTERGGAGKDKVVGSGGADNLFGEDGSDTVNSKDGVSGNDRLDGGAGTDTKVTDTKEASIVGFP